MRRPRVCRSPRVLRGVLAAWLSLAPACQRGIGEDVGQQAADLDRAIEALRAAPNQEKHRYLERLRGVQSSEPQLAALKRVCEQGYSQHVAALERVARVKKELAHGARHELKIAIEQARNDLLAARGATETCVEQQAAMKERFRLQ